MNKNKIWLITGGTGSLGKALTRYLLDNLDPKKVIIFSRDELKQLEMKTYFDDARLRFILGDVRQRKGLRTALRGTDIVIHAAALKQVPAAEYNVSECILTNVHGSENVAECSIEVGVEKVLLISTDKACLPINSYGKAKALAESIFTQSNAVASGTKTVLSSVRYGNVINSRGSVIPIFKKQCKEGTLTVTDKKMTRFWIEMKEAVNFILHCIDIMQGGEIFIPKIKSARVVDVAKAIGPGCHLAEVGIRPGEKLHETLLTENEAKHARDFKDHYIIEPEFEFWDHHNIGGSPLPEDFSYSSDNNKQWLTIENIRKKVGGND